MQYFDTALGFINGLVWGPYMMVLILGTGMYLMLRLKAIPLLKMNYGFKQLMQGRKTEHSKKGEISPFHALMTSLSATIGTGNIAGVATAIGLGGPGALFWMWCTALVGMATKYAEAVLAVHYREKNAKGKFVGGPMYYIKNGLGVRWKKLGTAFAFFGMIAGFGIGNTVQANSVASALNGSFEIPVLVTGVTLAIFVALVLLGGVKRIAKVAGILVPFMASAYIACGLWVLIANISAIPAALELVIKSAFTPVAAQGGFAGAAVMAAIQFGVARGIFSNEAGLGSAPIAHAAAKTNSPVKQGVIAMLGTFIDTLVICTITGLAIIVTGSWTLEGLKGTQMTQAAFNSAMPYGDVMISVGIAIFAFTTLLGWSYYGERCAEFLLGTKITKPFRLLWVFAIPIGATMELSRVWALADTLNGLMALPNLIALLLLSPVVVKLSKIYFIKKEQ